MIITVTPNPSLDRAYELDLLAVGEVNRSRATHIDAGGKGINISRALVNNGIDTLAVFPSGGPDGAQLVGELAALGVPTRPVGVTGATRSNITLVEPSGSTTKINAPGPVLDRVDTQALLDAAGPAGDGSGWLVGAGSLPSGVPDDFYVELAELARSRGLRFAVDTSGSPLLAVVRAGRPDLIKPNDEELAEILGSAPETVADLVAGCRTLIDGGVGAVLVSLGGHGAMLVTERASWWAGGQSLVPLSTVGAGDTTLAGFLAAAENPATAGDPAQQLRTAVAWGRAAVLLPGSAAPHPHHIDLSAVRVVAEPHPQLFLKEL